MFYFSYKNNRMSCVETTEEKNVLRSSTEDILEITNKLHGLKSNDTDKILCYQQPSNKELFIPLLENSMDTPSYYLPDAWKIGSNNIFTPGDRAVCLFFNRFYYYDFKYFVHYQTMEYTNSFFDQTYWLNVIPNTKKYALALLLLYQPSNSDNYFLISGKQLKDVLNHKDFRANFVFMEIDKIESIISTYFLKT